MAERFLTFFRVLKDAQDQQRRAILKTLSPSQHTAILEAIYNVLKGTCDLSDKDKKKLFRYKTIIRKLVSKTTTRATQRRLLIKYQHLLPVLLKTAITYLEQ